MDNKLWLEIEEYIQEHYLYSERQKQKPKIRFSISPAEPPKKEKHDWKYFLAKITALFEQQEKEDTFSERLLKLIAAKGLSDVEVYKKANIDRRLFSKIKNKKSYKPSKNTAIALALALELEQEAFEDLLERAGFSLSNSYKEDVIINFFLANKQYDIVVINEILDYYALPILGERKAVDSND